MLEVTRKLRPYKSGLSSTSGGCTFGPLTAAPDGLRLGAGASMGAMHAPSLVDRVGRGRCDRGASAPSAAGAPRLPPYDRFHDARPCRPLHLPRVDDRLKLQLTSSARGF